MIKAFLTVTSMSVLVACGFDPIAWESAPVTVNTAQGPVVCQLYTKELVSWDRAIQRPESMSVEAADKICVHEGKRQQWEHYHAANLKN